MIPDGCVAMSCEHAPAICNGCRRSDRSCALTEDGYCWRCGLAAWEAFNADDARGSSVRAKPWAVAELVIDDAPPARGRKR